jgi:hypothetical protein
MLSGGAFVQASFAQTSPTLKKIADRGTIVIGHREASVPELRAIAGRGRRLQLVAERSAVPADHIDAISVSKDDSSSNGND